MNFINPQLFPTVGANCIRPIINYDRNVIRFTTNRRSKLHSPNRQFRSQLTLGDIREGRMQSAPTEDLIFGEDIFPQLIRIGFWTVFSKLDRFID
jgi:hypothetical protein